MKPFRFLSFSLSLFLSFSLSLFLYFSISLFLSACSDTDVPDDRLVQAYADVIVVRETFADSVVVRQKSDSILTAHGYDSVRFAQELRSMSNTPQLFKSFYDSVSANISRKRAAQNAKPL